MRRRYVRNEPDRRDDLLAGAVAGALAAGVGAVTFYLVRLLLEREPLPERPAPQGARAEGEGASEGARGASPGER